MNRFLLLLIVFFFTLSAVAQEQYRYVLYENNPDNKLLFTDENPYDFVNIVKRTIRAVGAAHSDFFSGISKEDVERIREAETDLTKIPGVVSWSTPTYPFRTGSFKDSTVIVNGKTEVVYVKSYEAFYMESNFDEVIIFEYYSPYANNSKGGYLKQTVIFRKFFPGIAEPVIVAVIPLGILNSNVIKEKLSEAEAGKLSEDYAKYVKLGGARFMPWRITDPIYHVSLETGDILESDFFEYGPFAEKDQKDFNVPDVHSAVKDKPGVIVSSSCYNFVELNDESLPVAYEDPVTCERLVRYNEYCDTFFVVTDGFEDAYKTYKAELTYTGSEWKWRRTLTHVFLTRRLIDNTPPFVVATCSEGSLSRDRYTETYQESYLPDRYFVENNPLVRYMKDQPEEKPFTCEWMEKFMSDSYSGKIIEIR